MLRALCLKHFLLYEYMNGHFAYIKLSKNSLVSCSSDAAKY